MPIIDSETGEVVRKLSKDELIDAANKMRGYNLISLCAAKSGHAGGTLSIMDIAAALYLNVAKHDPKNFSWKDRDRIIWSAGHKAPSIYVAMGMAGYYNVEDVATLRKLDSPFQGHPHWLKLDGIEASTGSLGQGLSISVGLALAARLNKQEHNIFCIMGDGEQQEGQVWEAITEAAHYKLDNITGIIDKNLLQIDGRVEDVMNVFPLSEKYKSFGWHVIEINGHNMEEILSAFEEALKTKGKPIVIIADTVKGKGISFMENEAGWHGKAPDFEQMTDGLRQLDLLDKLPANKMLVNAKKYQEEVDKKLEAKFPKFSKNYWWNSQENMKVEMDPTRLGFGKALEEEGDDERIVCLGLDISGSITIDQFYKENPERKNRFFSMGIAEQSGTCAAAGLAKEGKLPVLGTYGVFSSGRNLDQLRTTVCYGKFNVLVAGAHGGVSVGADGATHQALEEVFQIAGLPNMNLVVPCDSIETKKATKDLLLEIKGPKYLRFAREATPVVTDENSPYVFGKANVIRFRKENEKFMDAFETFPESEYKNENEDLTIIACGPMVPEAMRAGYILKKEFDIEARVINMHTLKPLDKKAIVNAAGDTGIIITAEEHQIGGMANIVSAAITNSRELYKKPVIMGSIGVKDRFGESGAPWELIKEFGLSAEHIAEKAKELFDFAKK